jgi:hypothetical protein
MEYSVLTTVSIIHIMKCLFNFQEEWKSARVAKNNEEADILFEFVWLQFTLQEWVEPIYLFHDDDDAWFND